MNQVCCDEWNAHERSYSNVRRWLKARLGHEGGSLSERDRRSFLIFICGPTCSCTRVGMDRTSGGWTERPVVWRLRTKPGAYPIEGSAPECALCGGVERGFSETHVTALCATAVPLGGALSVQDVVQLGGAAGRPTPIEHPLRHVPTKLEDFARGTTGAVHEDAVLVAGDPDPWVLEPS